jgi:hypothetical protein
VRFSTELDKIAPALVALQADCPAVRKESSNPHFKSKYASLDAILDVVKPVANKHGIAIIQGDPEADTEGRLSVGTRLLHNSGQWVENAFTMPVERQNPQGIGSAITYGRRYSLGAILAIATDDDDDANAGSQKPAAKAATPATKPAAKAAVVDAPSRNGQFKAALDKALDYAKCSTDAATEATTRKLKDKWKDIATAKSFPTIPNDMTPEQYQEAYAEWRKASVALIDADKAAATQTQPEALAL